MKYGTLNAGDQVFVTNFNLNFEMLHWDGTFYAWRIQADTMLRTMAADDKYGTVSGVLERLPRSQIHRTIEDARAAFVEFAVDLAEHTRRRIDSLDGSIARLGQLAQTGIPIITEPMPAITETMRLVEENEELRARLSTVADLIRKHAAQAPSSMDIICKLVDL